MEGLIPIEKHSEILRESVSAAVAIAIEETKKLFSRSEIEAPIGMAEAAAFIGIEENTLYNLISGGSDIPSYKRGKRFFYKSELDRWIKSGRCKSTKAQRKARIEQMLTSNKH